MLLQERHRWLIETVRKQGSLSVSEAARALKVTRMTVYRDLSDLDAQGALRKVYGGAVALHRPTDGNGFWAQSFEERRPKEPDRKTAISRHLARLLEGSHTLAMDASSTVFALAHELPGFNDSRSLFVVTGGVPLFHELMNRGGRVRIALHGGEPHPRTGSLVGPLALASLKVMRFDWAVVSAVGMMEDEGVVYDSTPEEAEIKRAYMAQARRKVLAIDTTKLNRSAPYRLADLSEFDAWVNEEGIHWTSRKATRARSARGAARTA
ncbi:MAG: DeoR/GlpR transcriptional regulator [Planctomycetota bacterium]|nr:DeoR/GlpR transcriptional regulator [Planctomycetota bacterium]